MVSPTVISSNGGDGVYITGRGTSNNVVEANYIGSDRCGCAAQPNGSSGVAITAQATANTIGGAGVPNVISGNSGAGVYIAGSGTSGNLVQRNLIGTTRFSDTALGNHGNGVTILDGATENTIGGTMAGRVVQRDRLQTPATASKSTGPRQPATRFVRTRFSLTEASASRSQTVGTPMNQRRRSRRSRPAVRRRRSRVR